MKVRCVKALTPLLKIGKVYEVIDKNGDCYKILDECKKEAFYFKNKFEIVEDDTMNKLNFIEVISNIKVGQEYINNTKTIKRDEYGISIIHNTKTKLTNRMAFNNETLFILKRKEYTFQEALLAYKKGQEIQSKYSNRNYKKVKNVDLYSKSNNYIWFENIYGFTMNEVNNSWYINE